MSQLLLSCASSLLGSCSRAAVRAGLPAAFVRHKSPLKKLRRRGPFNEWTVAQPDPFLLTRHVPKSDERLVKSVRPPSKYQPHSVHYDPLVASMAGHFVKSGRRDLLRDLFNEMMAEIKHIQFAKRKAAAEADKAAIEVDPVKVIHKAVENCSPLLIIKHVFRAGFLYKVPCPLRESESQMRAFLYLKEASKVRGTKEHLYMSLARELVNASNNEGKAVHMKLTVHKECEENRAYANYRLT